MTNNISKKELYRQIFNITYLSIINGLITENRYIDILQKLTMNGFKTYHINKIDKLIIYMYNIGSVNAFNISILIHFRDINYKTLSNIAKNFNDIRDIFSIKKKNMITRIEQIHDIIKNKITIIKCFKKTDKYNSINLALNSNNSISNLLDAKKPYLSNEHIKKEWNYYTRLDIMDRLHLLVSKYYTLEELQFMNIELKLLSMLNKYSCEELETYYIYVINTIEIQLKEWLTICKMYIDIEINYLECCKSIINNKTTKLYLTHFMINIIE